VSDQRVAWRALRVRGGGAARCGVGSPPAPPQARGGGAAQPGGGADALGRSREGVPGPEQRASLQHVRSPATLHEQVQAAQGSCCTVKWRRITVSSLFALQS